MTAFSALLSEYLDLRDLEKDPEYHEWTPIQRRIDDGKRKEELRELMDKLIGEKA